MLETREHGTARELAKAERVNEIYIWRALRLTLPRLRWWAPLLAGRGLRMFRSVHTSNLARNGRHSREGWLKIPEIWRGAWEAVR